MKERMKALRFATDIRDGSSMFSTLQLLRLELELRPTTPLRCRPQSDGQTVSQRACMLGHVKSSSRATIGQAFVFSAPNNQNILPCAERLMQFADKEPATYQDTKASEALSKECEACENVIPMSDLLITSTAHPDIKSQKLDATALHFACTLPNAVPLIQKLCSSGCDVNHQNADGQTPLHILLMGDVIKNWDNLIEAVKLLISLKIELSIPDNEGNTPLLYSKNLLKAGAFEKATELSRLLLEAGSNPNVVNAEGRSLLTYSVNYLDDSVSLTRLLLNYGASVWNAVEGDKDQSAFTWFLRAVIYRRKVENCSETLALLSQIMGECPKRMHSHVLRTMFRHVKCYKILGPVFYQLKLSMMKYWTQPHDLQYICWRAVRKSLGSRRIMSGAQQLGLPRQMEKYLLME